VHSGYPIHRRQHQRTALHVVAGPKIGGSRHRLLDVLRPELTRSVRRFPARSRFRCTKVQLGGMVRPPYSGCRSRRPTEITERCRRPCGRRSNVSQERSRASHE
jgi:hypothetical protein